MPSSRVVLSPLGASALVGGLGTLILGLLTLNLLLLVVPLAALALTTTELLAFDRSTRNFGPSWFRWQRLENSSEVRIDGVGSMALDLERVGRGSVYLEVFDPQPEAFEVVLGSPRLLTWWADASPVRLASRLPAAATRPIPGRAYDRRRARPARLRLPNDEAREPLGGIGHAGPLRGGGDEDPPGLRGAGEAFRRRAGSGSEFRSLREYQPLDDARKIAWRRSGLEKVYVREHEEEAHPELLILLDTGRGMRLGVPGEESLEQAVEGGTVLAGQAIGRSDRVALLTFSDRLVEFVPPQRGPEGAELLTQAFGRVTLAPAPFDLARALAAAGERLAGPTVIVLFSTLETVEGRVAGAVAALRTRGHRLVALCPQVATMFPPPPEGLATRTMGFALDPTEREMGLAVGQLRDAGATVIEYPVPQVREVAAEVLAWITSGGGPA